MKVFQVVYFAKGFQMVSIVVAEMKSVQKKWLLKTLIVKSTTN